MSTSDRRFQRDGQHRESTASMPALSRYDLVLALIPAAFVLTTVGAGYLDVAFPTAMAVADALFVNPPTDGRRTR